MVNNLQTLPSQKLADVPQTTTTTCTHQHLISKWIFQNRSFICKSFIIWLMLWLCLLHPVVPCMEAQQDFSSEANGACMTFNWHFCYSVLLVVIEYSVLNMDTLWKSIILNAWNSKTIHQFKKLLQSVLLWSVVVGTIDYPQYIEIYWLHSRLLITSNIEIKIPCYWI